MFLNIDLLKALNRASKSRETAISAVSSATCSDMFDVSKYLFAPAACVSGLAARDMIGCGSNVGGSVRGV